MSGGIVCPASLLKQIFREVFFMTVLQWHKVGKVSLWICIISFLLSWIVQDATLVWTTYIISIVTLVLAGFVFMKKFKCPYCGQSLGTKFSEMNSNLTKCPHCNKKLK